MALEAGRVGVAPSEVDPYGRLLNGGGQRVDIVNNLNETTPGKALDATQGRVLKEKLPDYDANYGVKIVCRAFSNVTFTNGEAIVPVGDDTNFYTFAFATFVNTTLATVCSAVFTSGNLRLHAFSGDGTKFAGTQNIFVILIHK